MSLIDMSVEYVEDWEIRKIMRRNEEIDDFDDDVGERMTKDEIDNEYDDLDIDIL